MVLLISPCGIYVRKRWPLSYQHSTPVNMLPSSKTTTFWVLEQRLVFLNGQWTVSYEGNSLAHRQVCTRWKSIEIWTKYSLSVAARSKWTSVLISIIKLFRCSFVDDRAQFLHGHGRQERIKEDLLREVFSLWFSFRILTNELLKRQTNGNYWIWIDYNP